MSRRPGFIPDIQRRQRDFRRLLRYVVLSLAVVASMFYGLGYLIAR